MTECNVKNRTIFCDDNLDILQGINSECIDLIYLDPPFNKNKKFTAPIGTSAEGASFKDIFTQDDLKEEWLKTLEENQSDLFRYLSGIRGIGKPYNFAYLAYMAIRLLECHRVLKPTGSIYLHCDATMSHYLKTTMDCIFGEKNFRNEIIWHYYNKYSAGKRLFGRNYDQLLFYACSHQTKFNPQRELRENPTRQLVRKNVDGVLKNKRGPDGKIMYRTVTDKKVDAVWRIPCVQPAASNYTGYPTQKPLALLKRIIQASSNPGDMVLDPFCGCATTCVAAEDLGRKWIGVDISVKAYELVKQRLTKEVADPSHLFKSQNTIHMRTDPPKRADQGADYQEQKFVYVISHPNFPGEYKVGIAKDWASRLNSYQTSDPDRQYKLEFKFETPQFRETESHIHEKFENKHEWVNANLKDIIDEIKNYKTSSR